MYSRYFLIMARKNVEDLVFNFQALLLPIDQISVLSKCIPTYFYIFYISVDMYNYLYIITCYYVLLLYYHKL